MINGHGNDKHRYPGIVSDFSSNVPSGINHAALEEHLKQCLPLVYDYPAPDAQKLALSLSQRLNITPQEICVTNGATEAIYLTAQAFAGSHSCILAPTFSEYNDACLLHRHHITTVYTPQSITPETQLFWLCNPNNPTGKVWDKEELQQFITQHSDTLFVIDQSYESLTPLPVFTAQEAVSFPNVILIHSMTKEYAVPGLRIGYITAHAALLKQIAVQRMPWSVNTLAIEAGCFLLQQYPYSPFCVDDLIDEQQYVSHQLQALGCIEVWPSNTNFILAQLRFGTATALKEYLATQHHLLIRDCSNFQGLDNRFFRIAIQSPSENETLLDAIEEFIVQ